MKWKEDSWFHRSLLTVKRMLEGTDEFSAPDSSNADQLFLSLVFRDTIVNLPVYQPNSVLNMRMSLNVIPTIIQMNERRIRIFKLQAKEK